MSQPRVARVLRDSSRPVVQGDCSDWFTRAPPGTAKFSWLGTMGSGFGSVAITRLLAWRT
eukprot:3937641-Rhodomonas_salina.1